MTKIIENAFEVVYFSFKVELYVARLMKLSKKCNYIVITFQWFWLWTLKIEFIDHCWVKAFSMSCRYLLYGHFTCHRKLCLVNIHILYCWMWYYFTEIWITECQSSTFIRWRIFFILATLCNLSVMGQKQSPFIKREALAQVFSCEFWGFFKKSSLYITPQGCQIIVLWCNFCQKIPPIQLIK